MRYLLIAFLVLFSSLNSSWAGVFVPEPATTSGFCHHGAEPTKKQIAVNDVNKTHDCCSDSTSMLEKGCLQCAEDCQCHLSSAYSSVFFVGILSNGSSSLPPASNHAFIGFVDHLPVAPVLKSFQPPKI